MKSNHIIGINTPVSDMIIWFLLFYLFCDFGDKVTDQFSGSSVKIYNVLWYQYPVDQQKHFILMILDANKPVYIQGFFVQSTRESFKKVKSY